MNIAMLGPIDTVHFRRLVRALADRGHRVHVVSMKPRPDGDGCLAGATIERFAVPGFGWRYPYRWRKRWEMLMRRLLRRFDVVNVHFLSDWGITESVAREGRLVVTAYGSDVDTPPGCPPPEPSLVAARKELLRIADQVVAPSRAFARRVAEFGRLDESRIEIIPFGVDTRQFAPWARPAVDASVVAASGCRSSVVSCQLITDDGERTTEDEQRTAENGAPRRVGDTLTVGYFKGFEPVYDPVTMVRAAAHVLRRCPFVRFELVGGGALYDECRRLAEQLGIEQATQWIGYQPHEAMPAVLSRWDVAAVSSVKESFCVAAIEAGAMGLPVVATDVGGLPEAIEDGRTGLLVRPGDPEALGEALLSLLTADRLRRDMGRAGRARVAARFEWNECVDRWIRMFQRVAEDERREKRDQGIEGTGEQGTEGDWGIRSKTARWRDPLMPDVI